MKLLSILPSTIALTMIHVSISMAQSAPEAIIDMKTVPTKGRSIIWSPLFQATWDKLNSLQQGKPKKSGQENKLILALDSYQWNEESVMPKEAYATYAGPATQEFIDATAASMKKDFSVDMQPSEVPISESAHAGFGILKRNLQFKNPFIKSKYSPLLFVDSLSNTHKVQFFGTAKEYSSQYRNFVSVLAYKNKGSEFIISVETKTPEEKVIIYRPSERRSMEDAINAVRQSIKKPLKGKFDSLDDPGLHGYDKVKIPYIALKAETNFKAKLQGLRFFEGNPTPWKINTAKQFTQFELHEKGARIRVDTQLGGEPFGESPKPIPRNFVCDRPFFVFLWRDKAATPYFALWVDSVDVLKRF